MFTACKTNAACCQPLVLACQNSKQLTCRLITTRALPSRYVCGTRMKDLPEILLQTDRHNLLQGPLL